MDMIGIRKGRMSTAAVPIVTMIALAVNYVLWTITTLPVGRKAILRKVSWYSAGAGAGTILIGYVNLAGAFVQCMTDIVVANLLDGYLTEQEIPLCGNVKDGGFAGDTTVLVGTNGNIVAQAALFPGIAAPTPVRIQVEVEEVG